MTNVQERNSLKVLSMAAFLVLAVPQAMAAVDPMVEAATIERIKPVGEVNVGAVPVAAAAPAAAAEGKSTYQGTCFACHGTGAAGAPKVGDKGAWKNRIAQGMDKLFDHAINGFKGMPAKGGNGGLSNDAVKAAVKYMVKNSK